jgi:hypothetical protein
MLSFTDFKLSVGLKDDDRDIEYASILRGLIQELYTIYGIALDKDMKTNTETITVIFDTPITLAYKNIETFSIPNFEEGVDYTIDKTEGILIVNSSGSIQEQDYEVTYDYYIFINESNQIILTREPIEKETVYYIDVNPFKINYIQYNGTRLIENVDYVLLGNKVIFLSAFTNLYTPIIFNLTVGYEIVPYDLKQAFYELAQYRMDRRNLKVDLISRIEDDNGTSTSYRKDSIPKHIKDIFYNYMGRRLAFS